MYSPTDIRPPFTRDTALAKVKAAEDAWNSRDPERVALAYSENSEWRNRDEFFKGREAIKAFLRRKWAKELDYRLKKVVSHAWERALGVRPGRVDAPARHECKRCSDSGTRTAVASGRAHRLNGSRTIESFVYVPPLSPAHWSGLRSASIVGISSVTVG